MQYVISAPIIKNNNLSKKYKAHTSDVTYTIHFSDTTCTGGEVTKTFMVFACSQPACVCSAFSATTSGTRVPSTTSSTEYIVGRYTAATNCTDSISITSRTGTNFLTGLRASGGNIYAKVAVANTGSERSSTYFVRQGSCEDYFTAYQSSGGTPPTPTTCTCTATPVTTSLPSGITSDVTVGSYTRSGDCSGAYRAEFTGSGTDFLGSFTFSSNVIKANVISANTTTSTRTATYRIYRGDTLCSSSFRVTQAAGSEPGPGCDTCEDVNVNYVSPKAIPSDGGTGLLLFSFRTLGCIPSVNDFSVVELLSSVVSNISIINTISDTWAVYGNVERNTGELRYIYLSIRFKGNECSAAFPEQAGQPVIDTYAIQIKVSSSYSNVGNTFIMIGDGYIAPGQVSKSDTGIACNVSSSGIINIGSKNVSRDSCNYTDRTFTAKSNDPQNDSGGNWVVENLGERLQYTVVNINNGNVTKIGSFTMREGDFGTCANTVYNLT